MTRREAWISAFVVVWLSLFNYESFRYGYLRPWLDRELPKVKFLFPPAGWIMFFRVGEDDARAEVYGIKKKGKLEDLEPIDPHRIFKTRWLGYDNIRRNVLVASLDQGRARDFCAFLRRKFPEYQDFAVFEAITPSVLDKPRKTLYRLAYKCAGGGP